MTSYTHYQVHQWRHWYFFCIRLNTILSWSIRLMRRLKNLSAFWSEESIWKEPDGTRRKNYWPNHFQNFITINFRPSVSVLAGRRPQWRPEVRGRSTPVRFTGRRRDPECFCRPATPPTSSFPLTFLPINLRSIGSIGEWQGSLKSRTRRIENKF